jgi:hypothetical protein
MRSVALALCTAVCLSAPVAGATPRELLVSAAFDAPDKRAALAQVDEAAATAEARLAANRNDREAQIGYATAVGYRAKLKRSPSDAKHARKLLEQIVAAFPRDAEANFMLGGWHLDSVAEGFLTASLLGAKKDVGLAGIDRAVALGGDRAMFKGFAALMRARLNPADPLVRTLAEQAAAAPATTPLDRIAKRDAGALLTPIRAGDTKATAALARRLLPFGRL